MFYLTMQHFKYSSKSVLAEYTQLALFRDEKGRQKTHLKYFILDLVLKIHLYHSRSNA